MKRILRSRLRRKVLVTLKTGDAFQGVFYEGDKQSIVLRSAQLADPRSDIQWVAANGEVVILLTDVAYLQFV